jgi:hypothetical protein
MRIAYTQFPDPNMCGLKRTPFLAGVGLLIRSQLENDCHYT